MGTHRCESTRGNRLMCSNLVWVVRQPIASGRRSTLGECDKFSYNSKWLREVKEVMAALCSTAREFLDA